MENSGTQTAIRDLGEITVGSVDQNQPDGTAPPKRPRRRRRYIIGAAAAAILLVAAAVGADQALAGTYSSEHAVVDYLHAQSRGDVNGMWANGFFQGGEGSYHDFFTKDALAAMMKDPTNRKVANVKVLGVHHVDGNTDLVTTSLVWNASAQTIDFKVTKDPSRMHALFFPSWRVVTPTGTIAFSFPNQGGAITIDGIDLPGSSGSSIPVIVGVHRVVMAGTPIVQEVSQAVDVTFPSLTGSATLTDALTPQALDAARQAVKDAFAACDAAKYHDCPGHTYSAPNDGFEYFLDLPSGHVFYSRYTVTMVGDPTSDMTTTFDADDGHLSVSGTCSTKLTTDRGKVVPNTGTFDGKLAWNGTKFDPDLTWTC